MIIKINNNDDVQEGRLPLHYAATREELKPIYTALVSKGEYGDEDDDDYPPKGRVQKPQARKLSVGGVPPPRPRGLHGRDFSKKLMEIS